MIGTIDHWLNKCIRWFMKIMFDASCIGNRMVYGIKPSIKNQLFYKVGYILSAARKTVCTKIK